MSRSVLITGASSGIGRSVALAHAAAGHRVVGTYATSAEAAAEVAATADRAGHDLTFHQLDVADAASVDELFAKLKADDNLPEVLVSNAGIVADEIGLKLSDDKFTAVIEANLTGSFRVARAALRPMVRARYGRIVFVSSVLAYLGGPGQANYAASKAGLIGMARSLVRETAARNITINVVTPGPIDTAMLATAPGAALDLVKAAIPVGRFGTPDEAAHVVSMLTAEAASFVTGAIVPVDGGLGMGH